MPISEKPIYMFYYRPVIILTAVDKIFEQLLCHQLVDKFEAILDPFMSAYRSGIAVKLLSYVSLKIGSMRGTWDFSTDMSKAFDSLLPYTSRWQ